MINNFKKSYEELSPQICLIIAKEHHDIAKKIMPHETTLFDANTFSKEKFSGEVETIPFLHTKHFVAVLDIHELTTDEIAHLTSYAQNPSPFVTLFLTAESLATSSKLFKACEKNGLILNLASEKPWEREKYLVEELIKNAHALGVHLSESSAKRVILLCGRDEVLLRNELLKLICFVGAKKEITVNDIDKVCTHSPQETLWQLGDAILMNDFKTAYAIGKGLMLGGTSLYALLAHLKTQFKTNIEIFSLLQEGGGSAVTAAYPYLKGGLLTKKIELVTLPGKKRLEQNYAAAINTEIEAKNSNVDLDLLLELLLIKICPSHSSQT